MYIVACMNNSVHTISMKGTVVTMSNNKHLKDLAIYYFIENDGIIMDDEGNSRRFRWLVDFKDRDSLTAIADNGDDDYTFFSLGNYYIDNNNLYTHINLTTPGGFFNVDYDNLLYFLKYWADDNAGYMYSSKSKNVHNLSCPSEEKIYYKQFFSELDI